jgi:hypothetical protein
MCCFIQLFPSEHTQKEGANSVQTEQAFKKLMEKWLSLPRYLTDTSEERKSLTES